MTAGTASGDSSKWKMVRPWQPPSSGSRNPEAALEAGRSERDVLDEDDEENPADGHQDPAEPAASARLDVERGASRARKRRQLEVVDISSTSVSLTVFDSLGEGQTLASGGNEGQRLSAVAVEAPLAHPPSISVKLNSSAWPHFFHSDSSHNESEAISSSESAANASNILVWGLSPGVNYQIELGVLDEQEEDDRAFQEAEEASDEGEATEENQPLSASTRNAETTEPDVPPPPYSSHDPSLPSDAQRDAEMNLRNMLDKLRQSSKQAETTLVSAIAAARKANDKSTREDQRIRQRNHMLEDSTARLREVEAEEEADSASITEAIAEAEHTEAALLARLQRRRAHMEDLERAAKERNDKDEAELFEMKDKLEQLAKQEDEVLARKVKLERELLPSYNIQLATLEADLRRLMDDHQRRQYAQAQNPMHYGYNMYQPSLAHVHARPGVIRPLNRYDNGTIYDGQQPIQPIMAPIPNPPQSRLAASHLIPAGLRRRSASLSKKETKPPTTIPPITEETPSNGDAPPQSISAAPAGSSTSKPASRLWSNSWASRVAGNKAQSAARKESGTSN